MVRMFVLFMTVVWSCVHSQTTRNDDLLQVNLVYRHGDRSAQGTFPTDLHTEASWPDGYGRLSEIGIEQHFRLGQWIRRRYGGFLSSGYMHREITVTSSDVERCLMSAQSNLAGLYYLQNGHTWNPDLKWQPVPVHTHPRYEDNELNMGEKCSKYDELYQLELQSPAVKEKMKQNKDLFDFLKMATGLKDLDIHTLHRVYDTLFCEKLHGMKVLDWVDQSVPNSKDDRTVYERMSHLTDWTLQMLFSGTKARYRGGPLLKEYMHNMENKIENKVPTKIFIHSGHDTTVAALLSSLGLFSNMSRPPYASMVSVELRQNSNTGHYINVFYKNTSDTAYLLTIPGCETNCPWKDFKYHTKDVVPGNWAHECGYMVDTPKSMTMIIILVVLLLVLMVCMAIACACACVKKGPNYHQI